MKIRSLLAATLLLSATGLGTALAAPHFGYPPQPERAGRLAAPACERPYLQVSDRDDDDRDDDHRKHASGKHRDHDDEDDDDDRDGRRSRSAAPMNPNAPVPDNGLFAGRARPQVQVQ